jgi:hypothetical protein
MHENVTPNYFHSITLQCNKLYHSKVNFETRQKTGKCLLHLNNILLIPWNFSTVQSLVAETSAFSNMTPTYALLIAFLLVVCLFFKHFGRLMVFAAQLKGPFAYPLVGNGLKFICKKEGKSKLSLKFR